MSSAEFVDDAKVCCVGSNGIGFAVDSYSPFYVWNAERHFSNTTSLESIPATLLT